MTCGTFLLRGEKPDDNVLALVTVFFSNFRPKTNMLATTYNLRSMKLFEPLVGSANDSWCRDLIKRVLQVQVLH